jgi:RNA polymerase sigma factor (sigma-70 family)
LVWEEIFTVEHLDQEILGGIRVGDSRVLGRLYQQHYPRIAQMIRTNSGTEDDARDIFQDAVMVLYSKAQDSGFQLTSSLFTFLFAVSRNLWLKKLRNVAREGVTIPVELVSIVDADPQEEAEWIHEAQLQLYRRKFRELGDGCQEILGLTAAGKKIGEIAQQLGMSSEVYARQRKFKCKEQLTRMIQGDPEFQRLRN